MKAALRARTGAIQAAASAEISDLQACPRPLRLVCGHEVGRGARLAPGRLQSPQRLGALAASRVYAGRVIQSVLRWG